MTDLAPPVAALVVPPPPNGIPPNRPPKEPVLAGTVPGTTGNFAPLPDLAGSTV